MKKIDIHCHVLEYSQYAPKGPRGIQLMSPEEQLEVHDKLNVDFGVILPSTMPEAQWVVTTNENCKHIVDMYPDRFTWFCNVDPRVGSYNSRTNLGHFISHYKSLGAKGVGEVQAALYADDPMVDNLFSYCEELDMPVLVHLAPQHGDTYGLVDEVGLPRIEKMLKKHPVMKMIGHSAAFWCELSADVPENDRNGYPTGKVKEGRVPKLMREYGNLYCDLSAGSGSNAMMRDPEFAAKFMEEFADRIYYGGDVCSVTYTFQYTFDEFLTKMLNDKMLSRENYEKIVRKNAEKLLGLK